MKIMTKTILAAMVAAAAVSTAEAKKMKPTVTLDTFPVACRPVHSVENREPSMLPKEHNFKLVWHDEFDGDKLDESKWSYRTNWWGKPSLCYAYPEDGCVEVRDGLVHLKLKKRPDGKFVSPQLQTGELMWDIPRIQKHNEVWPLPKRTPAKFLHRYGYYECRCRLQQMPGLWTAFWMQAEGNGATLDPRYSGIEHDVLESMNVGRVIPHAFHYNGYGFSDGDWKSFHIPNYGKDDEHDLLLDEKEFHIFGLLWTPESYTVYVDGRKRGSCSQAVSQVPEFLLLSTEPQGYRYEGGPRPELEAAAKAGDEFLVDYVRVYDIVD